MWGGQEEDSRDIDSSPGRAAVQRRELGTTEEKWWRLKMRLSVDRNAAKLKLKCTVMGGGRRALRLSVTRT